MAGKIFFSNGCGIRTSHTRGMKGKGTHCCNMQGMGMGAVLLNGGIGGASSYSSVDDYIATTGRNPYKTGGSLERMNKKLESLVPNKKKPKNINFSL